MADGSLTAKRQEIALLRRLEERILWLAAWTIHNANHLRESRDGLKVGGHQASSASIATIMTALYMKALRPQDRVAVKPHASPVFHAIQHLFGRQSLENLQRFRALGGAQSYPSRTKDVDDVDFSTGSVGLGVAMTAFASLAQDYLAARGAVKPEKMGRMISLLGDAELDEGNIYEALIEACKHDIRNTWWIVDYNRQSLDATTQDRMFTRYGEIFEAAGWTVETLKWSKRQRDAFARPGGERLREWIETAPNDLYSALTYQGGAAWRERLNADLADSPETLALVAGYKDPDLAELMTELGGHCLETLLEAFERASHDDAPRFFIAYTVKGLRLPFQGHKDNHAGLMTPSQIAELRARLGVVEGEEWDPLSGLSAAERTALKGLVARAPFAAEVERQHVAPTVPTPGADELLAAVGGDEQSTQAAFGKVMFEIAARKDEFAGRVVTTSPDVTVSTNLGGFVNRRGVFHRRAHEDVFKRRRIPSAQVWAKAETGQHVELGIAENNLFIALAALGLTAPLFGERLFPVGTLYDPFIARGLDALNYACYQDARFLLVATPSGLTLAPEGGAHQSINAPVIGMAQPGLDTYEPAFADETAVLMAHAFDRIQAADGGSTYLRLSTRVIAQPERTDDAWRRGVVDGAYWLKAPAPGAKLAIVYSGALAPEALAAFQALAEDMPEAGLLAVTSADVLHRDWTAAGRARWTGQGVPGASTIETLLAPLDRDAGLVTLTDGAPLALSWLGSVRGQRVRALGLEAFGQSGDLPDLYRKYRLDADAVLDACADLLA